MTVSGKQPGAVCGLSTQQQSIAEQIRKTWFLGIKLIISTSQLEKNLIT